MEIPVFDISINPELSNGEHLGIGQIAYTSDPAILLKGFAFDAKTLKFKDDLKLRVVAPIMIPMSIYRFDEDGEYFARFTKETIEELFVDFQSRSTEIKNKFNLDHNQETLPPSFILECWIVGKDPKADKSFSVYGLEVPEGSVMVVSQFRDKEYFQKEIIEKDRTGYSIEGFLGLELTKEIKNKIKMSKKKFMAAYLEDGSPIWIDKLEVGGEVNTVDENMDKAPIFDGEHKLKDDNGTVIVTVAGKITEIKTPAPVAAEVVPVENAVEPVVVVQAETAPAEVPAEVAPVKAAIDANEVLAIVQPKFDEILKLIAELKSQIESDVASESIVSEGLNKTVNNEKHQRLQALEVLNKFAGY